MPDSTAPRRHFPPPWIVEDKDAYFIVRDLTALTSGPDTLSGYFQ
jgi:hypothetical protein